MHEYDAHRPHTGAPKKTWHQAALGEVVPSGSTMATAPDAVLLSCAAAAAAEAGSGGDGGGGSQELPEQQQQQHQNGTAAADGEGTENEEPLPSGAAGDQQEVLSPG